MSEWRDPEVPARCRGRAGKETPVAQVCRQPGVRSPTSQGTQLPQSWHPFCHRAEDYYWWWLCTGSAFFHMKTEYFLFKHRKGSLDNSHRAKFLNIEVPDTQNAEETWIRMTNITSASFLYWKKNTFSTNNMEETQPAVINQAGVFWLVFAFFKDH